MQPCSSARRRTRECRARVSTWHVIRWRAQVTGCCREDDAREPHSERDRLGRSRAALLLAGLGCCSCRCRASRLPSIESPCCMTCDVASGHSGCSQGSNPVSCRPDSIPSDTSGGEDIALGLISGLRSGLKSGLVYILTPWPAFGGRGGATASPAPADASLLLPPLAPQRCRLWARR